MRFVAFLCLLSLATAAHGQQIEYRKLNGPLARIVSGDVSAPQLSPDGKWAVFLADRDVDERPELYSAPSDGSAPAVKLSAPLGNGFIFEFRITPDSERVVYRLEANLDELRSAPLDGSAPAVQLNTQPLARITSFEFAAKGSRLAFLGSAFNGSSPDNLHGAPLDGSAPSQQLNPPLPSFGFIGSYAITPDGSRVVYAAGQEDAFVRELFAVPSTGGTPVKLSGAPVATADVLDFVLSPDGARAVYRADQRVDETYELFTTLLDGSGSPVPLTTPGVGTTEDYRFAAGGRLLFLDGSMLASVPGDGSAAKTPLGNLAGPYRLSPDGTRVVFHSYTVPFDLFLMSRAVDGAAPGVPLVDGYVQDTFRVGRDVVLYASSGLFSVPLDSVQEPVRLDAVPASGFVNRFELDREGKHALYVKDQRLMRVPVHRPQDALELAAGVDGDDPFFVTPKAARTHARRSTDGRELASPNVIFLREEAFVKELHSVPLDGSRAPVVLNLPFTLTELAGSINGYLVNGSWLVYRAQQDEAYVDQLFGVRLDQPGPAVELDGPVPPYSGLVGSIARPSGHFVYPYLYQLYSVPLDGGAAVQLSSASAPGEGILQFALDGGETRAVFLQATSMFGPQELFVRPVDGSAPALRLSPPGVDVGEFRLSPDGARAVYRTDLTTREIFAVPLDGSATPVKLNGTIPQFYEGVREFVFSPDGQRVVYVAHQDNDGFPELHSAAIDGSGEVLIAEPPHFFSIDLPSLAVSTTGFVVYTAEGDTEDRIELYSVPLLGGSAPVKLNGPLIPEGDVDSRIALTADGARVVFSADDLENHRLEVFSAPVDGGAPAVRLSGVMDDEIGADFQLDPDSTRLVIRRYGPAASPGALTQLLSVPVDGSSAPLTLDESISFASFTLLGGGERVLYTKPGPYSLVDLEIFLVSTSGGTPVRVNRPVELNGEAGGYAVSSPGIVYIANQDDPGQYELFQAVITKRAPR